MKPPRRTPTLKSIADAAGVTTMTVSRVLRNQPHVIPEIRKRVLELAKMAGYKPNAFATALAGYRSESRHGHRANLACLVGHKDLSKSPIATFEHYRLMAEFAQEYAARYGYSMDVIWLYEPSATMEKVIRAIKARGVAGLVLLSMHSSEIDLNWEDYSCAYISYNNRLTGRLCFPYTTYDIEDDMTVAYSIASERGYSRIGLMTYPVEIRELQHRMLGAYLAARYLLHPKCKLPIFECNFWPVPPAQVNERFLKWFRKYRPDAIICAVRGGTRFIQESGIQIPRELGVLDINLLTDDPFFSGMRRPFKAMAEQGVKQVIDQISRNAKGEVTNTPGIVLASEWFEGKSLPTLKPARSRPSRERS